MTESLLSIRTKIVYHYAVVLDIDTSSVSSIGGFRIPSLSVSLPTERVFSPTSTFSKLIHSSKPTE